MAIGHHVEFLKAKCLETYTSTFVMIAQAVFFTYIHTYSFIKELLNAKQPSIEWKSKVHKMFNTSPYTTF